MVEDLPTVAKAHPKTTRKPAQTFEGNAALQQRSVGRLWSKIDVEALKKSSQVTRSLQGLLSDAMGQVLMSPSAGHAYTHRARVPVAALLPEILSRGVFVREPRVLAGRAGQL